MDNTVPETDWEYEYEVYLKLLEAEREEKIISKYYSSEEVWDAMTKAIEGEIPPRYYTSDEVREMAYKAARGE
ncbi:MAG: hypothetical protein NC253_08255 [Ruminococcus sp.]|nr:hypothetical protein [Ruminococcus sp.]MCM1382575.1 hypothetical protein [Muribaculaceae bacterium]MCM1479023.1 hypothetical protein [Muribaculaceae bacterium]